MFISALMLVQAATSAPTTPPAALGQKPTAKVECRMITELGSRIPTRICRLDKEWELLAKDAQDDLRNSRNKSFGMNPE
jgi:hypothetical protein